MDAKKNMRHHRVVVTRHGGPDVLQVVEEALPELRPGEVRVKVLAAGVSAYDLMFRLSLLMMALFVLTPDGKQTPSFPDLGKDKVWYRTALTELLDLLAAGRLKPVVAECVPLTEAARARTDRTRQIRRQNGSRHRRDGITKPACNKTSATWPRSIFPEG